MSTSSGRRLGEPIEVPWWALVVSAPPVVVIVLALVLRGSLTAVLVGVIGSVLMLVALYFITSRSRNGHVMAIYLSGAYAVWVFIAICWGLLVWVAPASCTSTPTPVVGSGCAVPSRS